VPGRTGGAEIIMTKKIPPSNNGNHGSPASNEAPKQEA